LNGGFADPGDVNPHAVTISWGDGQPNTTLTLAAGVTAFSASHQYADDNPTGTAADSYNVTVVVTDSGGAATDGAIPIRVNNVAPQIASNVASQIAANVASQRASSVASQRASITGPSGPVSIGSGATLRATFTDVGTMDSHTCIFTWDDGKTSTVTAEGFGSGSCRASHVYAAAGIYTVSVEVRDDDTGSVTRDHQLVVYDPNGDVTGGGWINSPPGAYQPNPFLTGKASFTLAIGYKKGATVPTGQTDFGFNNGQGDSDDRSGRITGPGRFRLKFESTRYDWLVVSSAAAIYQGSGTINGTGDYGFLVSVVDDKVGRPPVDRFRIKIWDKVTGAVVYGNEFPADEYAVATFPVVQGNIVVK